MMIGEFVAVNVSDLPAAIGIALQAGHAARVEVKVAIVVEMGAGDSADDADDGKIMAHDDDMIGGRMARGDLGQARPRAIGDVDQAFAAGNL